MTLLVGQIAFAQNDKVKAQSDDKFYLQYYTAGLGSNVGKFMPTLTIHNTKFRYIKEQNSYRGKRNKKKEFINKGTFRQGSIDSILSILSGLRDSLIYRTNPCIMSGSITYLTIAFGADTTKFTLHNTSDYTALKIVDIINPYLPVDKKLYHSAEKIKEEEECWTYFRKRIEQQEKDRRKVKQ